MPGHDPDRRGLHAARDVALADTTLPQRKIVGQHLDARRERVVQRTAIRPRAAVQHPVLDEVENHRRTRAPQPDCELEVAGHDLGGEVIPGLDQQVVRHVALPVVWATRRGRLGQADILAPPCRPEPYEKLK